MDRATRGDDQLAHGSAAPTGFMLGRIVELARLSQAGRSLRPVFIVGEARSGTSLLYRLLQQQPAFGPDPVHLVESAFVERLCSATDLQARSWPMRNYLTADHHWAEYVDVARPLLPLRQHAVHRSRLVRTSPRAASLVGIGVLARAYLAKAAEHRHVTRLLEKSPHQVTYTGHLLRWFRDTHIIYITRHPVDVLASYRRRGREDARRSDWAEFGTDAFSSRYTQRTTTALQWAARRPDAFRMLHYEHLVQHPLETIESVCDFAAAPFDPRACRPPTGEHRSPDPLVWGDVVEHTKEWREYVTVDEAAELEDLLRPMMSALGYSSYADSSHDEP